MESSACSRVLSANFIKGPRLRPISPPHTANSSIPLTTSYRHVLFIMARRRRYRQPVAQPMGVLASARGYDIYSGRGICVCPLEPIPHLQKGLPLSFPPALSPSSLWSFLTTFSLFLCFSRVLRSNFFFFCFVLRSQIAETGSFAIVRA